MISGLEGVRKGFMVLIAFELNKKKRRMGLLKKAVPGGENSMDTGLDGEEKWA